MKHWCALYVSLYSYVYVSTYAYDEKDSHTPYWFRLVKLFLPTVMLPHTDTSSDWESLALRKFIKLKKEDVTRDRNLQIHHNQSRLTLNRPTDVIQRKAYRIRVRSGVFMCRISKVTRLFVRKIIQTNKKETILALHYWLGVTGMRKVSKRHVFEIICFCRCCAALYYIPPRYINSLRYQVLLSNATALNPE